MLASILLTLTVGISLLCNFLNGSSITALYASAPVAVTSPAPSEPQTPQPRPVSVAAKQPDRVAPRNQGIPNLKMSSPSAPGKNLASLPEGSSAGAVDIESASADAPGGISSSTFAARAENQPVPPPMLFASFAAAPSAKVERNAKLISSTRPVYPPAARASNIQGNVVINANINEKGIVVAATADSGPMFLRQAAVDAVKQWKYSPAQVDGKPAPSQVRVTLEFRLN